jgi:hypothetical protein
VAPGIACGVPQTPFSSLTVSARAMTQLRADQHDSSVLPPPMPVKTFAVRQTPFTCQVTNAPRSLSPAAAHRRGVRHDTELIKAW